MRMHDLVMVGRFSSVIKAVRAFSSTYGSVPCKAHMPPTRLLHDLWQAGEEPAVLEAASGGNLHAFTAASSCAVLDLLAPPYDTRNRAPPACWAATPGLRR